MQLADRIYGSVDLDEPVLIDLIDTAAMRRLRGVLQHGVTALLGITQPVSRYEHSLGVMLLVRRLGAGLDEQIAALLHDVSHTAFSHVIDYVFDDHHHQSYHEERKEWFMEQSDLPGCLKRYGYNWRAFLNEEDFPLLEQPSPSLCADRLDYFLRDSLDLGLTRPDEIQGAIAHLRVHAGRIVVDDLAVARWMADTFIAADQASWANFREVGLYELTAMAIREAFRIGALQDADLWGLDQSLWNRLASIPDPGVQAMLRQVSPLTQFIWDADNPDFWVGTKLRTIDPEVLLAGELRRLSAWDAGFAQRRADYLASNSGQWPMRILPPPTARRP
jgi:HD superfamily phosphohydrolase